MQTLPTHSPCFFFLSFFLSIFLSKQLLLFRFFFLSKLLLLNHCMFLSFFWLFVSFFRFFLFHFNTVMTSSLYICMKWKTDNLLEGENICFCSKTENRFFQMEPNRPVILWGPRFSQTRLCRWQTQFSSSKLEKKKNRKEPLWRSFFLVLSIFSVTITHHVSMTVSLNDGGFTRPTILPKKWCILSVDSFFIPLIHFCNS